MGKTAVSGIVFIVLSLLPFICHSAPLTVTTYNTGNIFVVPKHLQRQKILAQEIEKRIIDANTNGEYFIFFLQEVFSPDFIRNLRQISSRHHIYMTNADTLDDKTYRHGLVTLTNVTRNFTDMSPIIVSETFTPWNNDMYENRHQRGILTLCLNLDMDDKPLCLVNLHMAYTLRPVGGLSSMHQEQLKQLLQYMETIPHQTIVAGDFNLGSIQWLIKEKDKHLIYNQAKDAPSFTERLWMDPGIENYWNTYVNDLNDVGFHEAEPDSEQVSFSPENGLVKNPGIGVRIMNIASLEIPYYGQIDHIFYKFSPHSNQIEYCNNNEMSFTEKYELPRSQKMIELSDHYAITATFEISLPALFLTRQ